MDIILDMLWVPIPFKYRVLFIFEDSFTVGVGIWGLRSPHLSTNII